MNATNPSFPCVRPAWPLLAAVVFFFAHHGAAPAQNGDAAQSTAPAGPGARPITIDSPPDPAALTDRGETGMSVVDLTVWNDPDFQRRFTQSYIAETEIEPRVTVEQREVMQEVLQLMRDEQLDAAAELIEDNRNEAASAVFDFTLANIHFQREEFDRAAEIYRVAVDKFPNFRRAWKNLGLIHVRQKEFEKAVEALTRWIELGGVEGMSMGLLGYAYSNLGDDLAAESAYRQAILLDPDTADWKMGLARSFFKQSRYAEAVSFLDRMLQNQPGRTDLWLLQANAYLGLEKPMQAAENYQIVDRLGASTPASLNMLGDIYINEQLFPLAVDAYQRAMQMEEATDPTRAIRAARILAARAAYDETKQLLAAINDRYGDQLDDEQEKSLLKLEARIAVAEGRADEEAEILKQIVELDPLDGEALILLGEHAARSDDLEQAVFYFERAANIEGFEADAKVRHAQALVREGRFQDAIPLLREAQQIKPRESVQKYLEDVQRVARSR